MNEYQRSWRRRLGLTLAVITGLLVVAHALTTLLAHFTDSSLASTLSDIFSLDRESNVPALFSGLLWGCCGYLALLPALPRKSAYIRARWIMLSLLFLYIAFDEVLVIHEQFAEPIRDLLSISDGNPLYHAWVVVAIVVALVLAGALLLLKHKGPEAKYQRNILSLMVILAGGVIALEVIGTQLYFSPLVYQLGPVLVEEMFEIGMVSFILYRLSSLITVKKFAKS